MTIEKPSDKPLFVIVQRGQYAGVMREERGDTFRVELFDALMLVGGGQLWESGELRDFPKADCRLFNDETAFAHAMGRCLEAAKANGWE